MAETRLIVEKLLDELIHKTGNRFTILDEIESLGQGAVKPLLVALDEPQYDTLRYTIIGLLGNIADPSAVDRLLDLLHHPDQEIVREAIQSLGRIGDARDVPSLLDPLTYEGPPDLFAAAVIALGEIGDPSAVEPLIDLMHRYHLDVLSSPPRALAKIGKSALSSLLDTLLHDSHLNARVGSVIALGEMASSEAVDALLQTLESPEEDMRWAAVSALGKVGGENVREALIRVLLRDASSQVRRYTASALGRMGDPEAVPTLGKVVQADREAVVRWSSADALGQLGGELALRALLGVLNDPDLVLQQRAMNAMAGFNDPRVVHALIGKLSDERRAYPHRPRVCDIAAEALERIGTPEALAHLARWRGESIPGLDQIR